MEDVNTYHSSAVPMRSARPLSLHVVSRNDPEIPARNMIESLKQLSVAPAPDHRYSGLI